jgi:hypothetical protein
MSSTQSRWSRIDHLSQRTRRVIAVASMIGLPGMFAWSAFWLRTSVPSVIWGPFSFVLILVTAVGAFLLYGFVRDRANFGADLDERQRQLRDRAWVMSYEVLAAAVIGGVVVIAVLVLGMGRNVNLDGTIVSAIAICTGVLIPLLPVAALAWVEPDAPAEA